VTSAYARLAGLPQVHASRTASTGTKGVAVQELVTCCQLPRYFASTKEDHEEEESEAVVVILGAVGNMEVLATCEILKMMLIETLQVPVSVVKSAQEPLSPYCCALLVVLTPGLLENAAFAEALLEYYNPDTPLQMVSVLADNYFQFPSAQFYAKLEDEGLPALGQEAGHRLVDVYTELFSGIALPFSPLASEAVLKLEVSELCRRRFRSLSVAKFSTGEASSSVKVSRQGTESRCTDSRSEVKATMTWSSRGTESTRIEPKVKGTESKGSESKGSDSKGLDCKAMRTSLHSTDGPFSIPAAISETEEFEDQEAVETPKAEKWYTV